MRRRGALITMLIGLLWGVLLLAGEQPAARATDPAPGGVRPRAGVTTTYTINLPVVLDALGGVATTVTPDSGGSVATIDGRASVAVPPGAVGETVRLVMATTRTEPPSGVSDFGVAFDISVTDSLNRPVVTLAQPATIQLSYRGVQLGSAAESDLRIFTRAAGGTWSELPTSLDTTLKTASAQVTHFSEFGLFGSSTKRMGRPVGIATDGVGNAYWLDLDSRTVRRIALATGQDSAYFPLRNATSSMGLDAGDVDFDPASQTTFLTDGNRVYAVGSDLRSRTVYERSFSSDSGGAPGDQLNGVGFDRGTGTLYVALKNRVVQVTPSTGNVVRSLDAPHVVGGMEDVVVDSRGRLFAVGRDESRGTFSVPSWGNLYYWDDAAQSPAWRAVAYGFAGPRGLAADGDGNVYVPNAQGDAISVVSGDDPAVTGVIRNVVRPRAVAVAGASLIVTSDDKVVTIERLRRDSLAFTASTTSTVSGEGSIVRVTVSPQDRIPAHHTLRIGGEVVHEIATVATGTISYQLPSIRSRQGYTGLRSPFSAPSGQAELAIGERTTSLGPMTLPELGNWRPGPSRIFPALPVTFAAGEWIVWSREWDEDLARVRSVEGLFPDWTADGGRWLAYQLKTPGVYHFVVSFDDGKSSDFSVTVTRTGDAGARDRFRIAATRGGTLYSRGVIVTVPPRALPGVGTYTLTVTSTVDTRTYWQGAFQGSPFGFRYQFGLDPRPARLDAPITIQLPYDAALAKEGPRALFFDSEIGTLIPLDHRLDTAAQMMILSIGPAEFSASQSPAAATPRVAPAAVRPRYDQPADDANPPVPFWGIPMTGSKALDLIEEGVGAGFPMTPGFWYHVADADHRFVVYFQDPVTSAYARTALGALLAARAAFAQSAAGWAMPQETVWVEIVPSVSNFPGGWNALGATSKWGKDGQWHIYLRSTAANDDELRSTAVHEFFHVLEFVQLTNRWSRFWASNWLLESAAVWAQYRLYGLSASTKTDIAAGEEFPHAGLRNWAERLSSDGQYAAGAFIISLVRDRDEKVIKDTLIGMNITNSNASEPLATILGDAGLRQVYEKFAKRYWLQTEAPFDQLSLTGTEVKLSQPSNEMPLPQASGVTPQLEPLSSYLFKVEVDADPSKWPAGFDGASGAVIRYASDCEYGSALVYDGRKRPTGIEFSGRTYTGSYNETTQASAETFLVDKLGTRRGGQQRVEPRYVLLVNASPSAAAICSIHLSFDAPTLTGIFYREVLGTYWETQRWDNRTPVNFRAYGGGLGAKPGKLLTTIPAVPEIAIAQAEWGEDLRGQYAGFQLPPVHYSGAFQFRVQDALGVQSNPVTLTLTHRSVITSVQWTGDVTLSARGWFLESPGQIFLQQYTGRGGSGFTGTGMRVNADSWGPTEIAFSIPAVWAEAAHAGSWEIVVIEADGTQSQHYFLDG